MEHTQKAVSSADILKRQPWTAWFPPGQLEGLDARCTLYEAYRRMNEDNLDGYAYRFEGKRYTHRETLRLVDNAAVVFSRLGVQKGETVGMLLNGSWEVPICLLALNKIGAVSKWIEPEVAGAELFEILQFSHIRYVVCDPAVGKELTRVCAHYKLSLNGIVYSDVRLPANGEVQGGKLLRDLLLSVGDDSVPAVPYEENAPAVIISTSGTTGKPKAIVHTNYNLNMCAKRTSRIDYEINSKCRIVAFAPANIGMCLITTIYTGLLCSAEVIITHGADGPSEISDFLLQYGQDSEMLKHKLIIISAPIVFRILLHEIEKIADVSFIIAMMAGGAKMEISFLKHFETEMARRNCFVPLCNGYAQNEMCCAVSMNPKHHNQNGSAGLTFPGVQMRIINMDTGLDVNVGETGMIIEKADTMFLCYENDPERTNKSKWLDERGEPWFITNDYGYINEDGYLYIVERASRTISVGDMKFPLSRIEGIISQHPAVNEVAVVAVEVDSPLGRIKAPFAFVRLHAEYEGRYTTGSSQMLDEIQCGEYRFNREAPVGFAYISLIPYTGSGKVDYALLTTLAQTNIEHATQKDGLNNTIWVLKK